MQERLLTARAAAALLLVATVACNPAATAQDTQPAAEPAVTEEGPRSAPAGWSWPDSLDAVPAAPASHEVLLENDEVRVLRVKVPAGEREPVHTHRWPSVMIVDHPARIRYYGEDGELRFESPPEIDRTPQTDPGAGANWLGPEGPHSVENIDTVPFLAYRVELKGATG